MKKFFDSFTIMLTVLFVLGAVVSILSADWPAFTWIIVGAGWMVYSRFLEIEYEEEVINSAEELEKLRNLYEKLKNVSDDKISYYKDFYLDYQKKYYEQLEYNHKLSEKLENCNKEE